MSCVRLGVFHVELQTWSPCDISGPRFALVAILGWGGHLFTRFFLPESDLLRPWSSRQGPAGTWVPGEGSVIRTDGEAGPALSPSPGSRCSLPPTASTFPQRRQSALRAGHTGVGGQQGGRHESQFGPCFQIVHGFLAGWQRWGYPGCFCSLLLNCAS